MNMIKSFGIALAALALTAAAAARADVGPEQARKLVESGDILSLEAIAEKARAARPGEILETELERKGNRYVYEVEVLDDAGTVWEVKLDARSGDLIKVEQEEEDDDDD